MVQVKLINHTPNPEMVIAVAARTCIQDIEYKEVCADLGEDDIKRILKTIISKNQHSILEHAFFTFSISGVSRVLSHQLVRHRIASYSQLSQQKTDSSYIEFTVPPELYDYPELVDEYKNIMSECSKFYRYLIKCGISYNSSRYILPAGFNTRIIATMNARSLFNLLAQRECEVEEWEFREVAHLMHAELMKVAPNIFRFAGPPCDTIGYCPEGKRISNCKRYQQNSLSEKSSDEKYRARLSQV